MKLASIIVLFNPNLEDLKKNIFSIIDNVEVVLLYQNSFEDRTEIEKLNYPKGKIIFLGENINVGIAAALNQGINWAITHGFTHLLTLDQDSFFRVGDLTKFKNKIQNINDYKIGVYAPNPYVDGNYQFTCESKLLQVDDAITSGSIFPLSIFNKFGTFVDALFIDAVDYEFCYRIKRDGDYKTIIFTDITLNHVVGYGTKTKLGFSVSNYSALRTYHIVRNYLIIWRIYGRLFPNKYKFNLVRNHILVRFLKIILWETDKQNKIKAIFWGFFEGLTINTNYFMINNK